MTLTYFMEREERTVTVSAPTALPGLGLEGGSIRRRNADVRAVCDALLSDMREHSMAYRIPLAALEEVLSIRRMEEFRLALEVMGS